MTLSSLELLAHLYSFYHKKMMPQLEAFLTLGCFSLVRLCTNISLYPAPILAWALSCTLHHPMFRFPVRLIIQHIFLSYRKGVFLLHCQNLVIFSFLYVLEKAIMSPKYIKSLLCSFILLFVISISDSPRHFLSQTLYA